jgi:hypothetical protein
MAMKITYALGPVPMAEAARAAEQAGAPCGL